TEVLPLAQDTAPTPLSIAQFVALAIPVHDRVTVSPGLTVVTFAEKPPMAGDGGGVGAGGVAWLPPAVARHESVTSATWNQSDIEEPVMLKDGRQSISLIASKYTGDYQCAGLRPARRGGPWSAPATDQPRLSSSRPVRFPKIPIPIVVAVLLV